MCQATQTTIIAPNPMLQGAILMQQMQGNMRSFGMGGQQFRQFFAGTRSSILGPVPMGMAMKSHMMGFPAARPYHQHHRQYYNNNNSSGPPTTSSSSSSAAYPPSASSSSANDAAARQPERKRDSDQIASGSSGDQPAAGSSTTDTSDKTPTADGAVGGEDGNVETSKEQPDEPVVKKQKTEEAKNSKEPSATETITIPDTDEAALTSEDVQSDDLLLADDGFPGISDDVETTDEKKNEVCSLSDLSASDRLLEDDPPEDSLLDKDAPPGSAENQEEEEDGGGDDSGSDKFYCYLCSITCQNQHNFRSHMNSIAHQQRMMEIQHMSNACLVTLLPRVQESLQGANKDGEKKSDSKRLCSTCHSHFTGSVAVHRRSLEHKLASRTDISSCAVCKVHFKTSQSFLEHLQSAEHKLKLQEKGCEALSKLAALDTQGFSLEDVEGSDEEEEGPSNEGVQGDGQDGWSSLKEVTLNDMTSDEEYRPDTNYGSSFLVPVAGFICSLCNKFYHFDSSALHSHCRSLRHFNNLKKYSALEKQKQGTTEPSNESLEASGSLRPATETSGDCPEGKTKPAQPVTALTRKRNQEEKKTESTSQESASSNTEQDLPQAEEEEESAAQECPAEESTDLSLEEDPAAQEGEKEAPAAKRNGAGRGKSTGKRRSGRSAKGR